MKLATILLLALASFPASADFTGRVVGVLDGDTVDVLDSTRATHRVRLVGIDAPEKKQPYGQVAKKALSDLVFQQQVSVETEKTDRYGRVLGKILVSGTDANLALVSQGLAWHFKRYQNEQPLADRLEYGRAETAAKEAKLGLWAENDPVAPWNWRKR